MSVKEVEMTINGKPIEACIKYNAAAKRKNFYTLYINGKPCPSVAGEVQRALHDVYTGEGEAVLVQTAVDLEDVPEPEVQVTTDPDADPDPVKKKGGILGWLQGDV